VWRRSVQAQSGPNWTRPTITTICSDVLLSDAALHRWAEGEETGRGMVVFTCAVGLRKHRSWYYVQAAYE